MTTSLVRTEVTPAFTQDDTPAIPTAAQMRLERFLSTTAIRTDEYFALFQDLTAEETKTIEIFRGEGEVSRTRRIVSDLVVYQAQIDNASIAEYRDVREVDGSPVPGREGRVEKMASLRTASASIRDELQRITRESTRYDLDKSVSGLTITEGLPVQAWARALFAFTVAGTETVEGRTTVVVDYRQTVPNARFGFKFSLPSELAAAQPLYRGRLWIDAETAHLWREHREIAVEGPSIPSPLVIQTTDFHYRASRFGVPLPARIIYMSSLKFEKGPDKRPRTLPVFRVTFDYGPFKRFTTTAEAETLAVAPTTPDTPPVVPEAPVRSSAPVSAQTTPAPDPAPDLGPEFGPDAPESGPSYEQLSTARKPAARQPAAPEPATRQPVARQPAPVARPVPPRPNPTPLTASSVPAPRTIARAPEASEPPVLEPPRVPQFVVRPPRAIQRIFALSATVATPPGLGSEPSSLPASTLSPPPVSPPPGVSDSAPPPRKQWRPPPS